MNKNIIQKWTDVILVSGPLFSWDSDTAASYLYNTYVAGMTQSSWDWFHANAGTYPLDAIGYHMYVKESSTDKNTIVNGYNYNLNDLWTNGIVKGENYRGLNPNPTKKIYVSEFSFPSTSSIGETGQAQDVTTIYTTVFSNNGGNTHVACAMWFTWKDFDSNGWGLLRSDGTYKPSWEAFQNISKNH